MFGCKRTKFNILGLVGMKNELITQPTPREWVEIKTRPWLMISKASEKSYHSGCDS
jgi:hypothetical protein